jgi:hypothetical protein
MIDEVVSEIQRRKEKLLEYIDSPAFSEKSKNRLKIQDACSRSEEAKIFALSACSKDPVFFINNFAWIFAAKSELQIDNDPNFPFILFDFQEDATYKIKESIDFGKDLIIEKSRDMGVSWLIVWLIIWFWLFDESFTGHLGSLTEDLVDNGTIDSLFGKIDYCLRNLPKWMLPARFNIKKHRQSMKLTNPETFSLITGQAPTQHFGRGPRKKAIFFDELPAWEYGKQAWDVCADTTSSRIGLGTSMGANFFKALRDGLLGNIDVLTLHWRLHPLKDDKWYEFEKSRRDEETIARELDISYEGSQVGRVYPEWIRNIEWIESEPDDKLPIYTFWDLGQSDNTAIIWFQGSMYNPIIIDAYTNFNKGADFYTPFITGMLDENDPRYNEQDKEIIMSHRRWRFPEKNIVGPDANFIHQSSNQSISDVFKSSGIRLHYETGSKDFLPRKEAMKIFLKNKIKVRKNPRTEYLSMCIDNAHYPNIQRGGMQETKSVLPVHDYTEAYRSAMEYGVFFVTRRKDSKNSMVSDKFKKGNPFISRFSKR